MIIGIDFDNTIVSYGELFRSAALERKLIPAEVPPSKTAVRDFLRSIDREAEWTELQGAVYGERIDEASPFPGVINFLRHCRLRGISTAIISHRTSRPHRGPDIDLHAAARGWIQRYLAATAFRCVDMERVYLERTREQKLERIAKLDCTHFIDDLPEFLTSPSFPRGVQRILFDPEQRHSAIAEITVARSWKDIANRLLEDDD